jgi:hypothetical protein
MTTTLSVDFNRHDGFVSPADLYQVLNIIGVGATGSNAALIAARMGFKNFRIWDMDVVEPHNLPNQAYDFEHIGMLKVEALKQVLQRFNPEIQVETNNKYFTAAEDGADLEGPLILTVDTMKARAEITACFDGNPLIDTVFESRLGFDHGTVNIIDNISANDLNNWRNSLLSDEEIPESPCGLVICTTMVMAVSALMVQQICNKYSSIRKGVDWNPKKKVVLYFNDEGIIAHSM